MTRCVCGALGCLYQQAGGTLSGWRELPSAQSGINSNLLTVIDVNGDGVHDIVEFFTPQSTNYTARITTLLQDLAGDNFTKVNSSLAGIWGIDGAAVVELDGNGRPDFATVGNSPGDPPRGELNVLLQDGNGAFLLTRNLPMPIPVTRVAAGDLNADGLNDLILLGENNRVLVVLQSAAVPGTFMQPRILN